MSLTARLERILTKLSKESNDLPGIKGWRFVVNETNVVSVGIKDNTAGSLYTPPSYRTGERGEVFIVWNDERISKSSVQSEIEDTTDSWLEKLKEWREASYLDTEDTEIYEPHPVPLVAVEDREVHSIVQGEDQILFSQIKRILDEKPRSVKINGGVQAAWGYRHVRTSTGLSVTYQESQYAISYSFDSLVGANFYKRRLIKPQEWDYLWNRTLTYYTALSSEDKSSIKESLVVLAPSVTNAMLGQFVIPNFSGQRVLDGQSAYSLDAFRKGEMLFASNLNLIIDPLRDFEIGSYIVTAEGVPAEKTFLINEGYLNSPYLRLKDARRWGISPTAIPNGTAGVYLNPKMHEEWKTTLEGIKDGVLIVSVLGLHTQDSVSGEYSLSAPQSLRIIDGKIVGKIDVKLYGNFFRDLASSETRYAFSDFEKKPYLILKTGLQNL